MKVLLCPLSDPGYLYPALAVGRELARRGHSVQVLGRAAARPVIIAAGLKPVSASPATGDGFRVGRWFSDGHLQYRAVREAAGRLSPDVLVTSVLGHGALLAGQVLDRPVVVIGFAAHVWNYADDPAGPTAPSMRADLGREHGRAPGLDGAPAGELRRWRTAVTLHQYHALRRRLGLLPVGGAGPAPLLGSAFLLRGDPVLEVPGARLPAGVQHVGPCVWEPSALEPEVNELVSDVGGRPGPPLVYVHLGRDFGGDTLWPRLNAAFTGTGLRAVVEQGRSGPAAPGPGSSIAVIRKPWMGPLVEQADAVLSSGTTAPVLAALAAGKPLVLAPSGSEQPVLTAACLRAGVARELPVAPGPQSAEAVRAAIGAPILTGTPAADLRARLAAGGGDGRAADAVEAVVARAPNRSRTTAQPMANRWRGV